MTDTEPTIEELLTVAGIVAFEGRRLIESTNHSLPAEMIGTLATLHQQLSVVGGAVMKLAAQAGVEGEVQRRVAENAARLHSMRAHMGQGGTA